jgi:hypothetical protein
LASAQIEHENKAKEYAKKVLDGVSSVFR